MGTIILRESRDSDYYVAWNTGVDAISCTGTRQEMIDYLWDYVIFTRDRNSLQPEDRVHPENQLQRCDILGASSRWEYPEGSNSFEGGWDDTGFVYAQQGWATREAVFKIARRMDESQDSRIDIGDLLRPFEDDE